MNINKRIYHDELLKTGLVPWTSWKTTKRRIETDDFPGQWDGHRWSFVIKEVEMWFKKQVRKAA